MTNFTVMGDDARDLLGKQIDELTGKVDALIRQRDAMKETIRELRADKARMDWLSVDRADSAIPRVWSSNESAEPVRCLHGDDLRAAIDAAMKAQSEQALDELAAEIQRLGLGD